MYKSICYHLIDIYIIVYMSTILDNKDDPLYIKNLVIRLQSL